jgi:hypothetical protein
MRYKKARTTHPTPSPMASPTPAPTLVAPPPLTIIFKVMKCLEGGDPSSQAESFRRNVSGTRPQRGPQTVGVLCTHLLLPPLASAHNHPSFPLSPMVLAGIGLGVGTFLIIFFSLICILSTVYSRLSRTTAPFLVGLSMLIIIILCLILLPKQSAVTTTAGVNTRTDAYQAALWGPVRTSPSEAVTPPPSYLYL